MFYYTAHTTSELHHDGPFSLVVPAPHGLSAEQARALTVAQSGIATQRDLNAAHALLWDAFKARVLATVHCRRGFDHVPREELTVATQKAFWKFVTRFNPGCGHAFVSCAVMDMPRDVRRELTMTGEAYELSEKVLSLVQKLRGIALRSGIELTDTETLTDEARSLGLSDLQISRILPLLPGKLSLDYACATETGEGLTLAETLADESPAAERPSAALEREEIRGELTGALDALRPNWQVIVRVHCGYDDAPAANVAELARLRGVSASSLRETLGYALNNLRERMVATPASAPVSARPAYRPAPAPMHALAC